MTIFPLLRRKADEIKIPDLAAQERSRLLRYACSLLGNRDDAEDAVQDLYIRLCDRPADEKPRNIQSYLYRSLHNLCTDRLRQRPLRTQPAELWTNICDEPPTNNEQELRYVQQLLSTLPPEQAEVIRLRFYGEKSFLEISTLLNTPLSTVKSRFRYGMEKLKNGLFHQSRT
ncbi:MAG: RNA polymerase sigma factor [Paraprevotella sp.]|nr:RNA polymerase sigma factor [Paraprevotella sp.]